MKFLVDTHVLLWMLSDPQKLSTGVREKISSSDHIVFVSLVSLWELQIKESIAKVKLPKEFYQSLELSGFEILPITLDHIKTLRHLPLLHRDPFDRMLIAQAQYAQLTLVTRDEEILRYDVHSLEA